MLIRTKISVQGVRKHIICQCTSVQGVRKHIICQCTSVQGVRKHIICQCTSVQGLCTNKKAQITNVHWQSTLVVCAIRLIVFAKILIKRKLILHKRLFLSLVKAPNIWKGILPIRKQNLRFGWFALKQMRAACKRIYTEVFAGKWAYHRMGTAR